jgi:hypothetical protein
VLQAVNAQAERDEALKERDTAVRERDIMQDKVSRGQSHAGHVPRRVGHHPDTSCISAVCADLGLNRAPRLMAQAAATAGCACEPAASSM